MSGHSYLFTFLMFLIFLFVQFLCRHPIVLVSSSGLLYLQYVYNMADAIQYCNCGVGEDEPITH